MSKALDLKGTIERLIQFSLAGIAAMLVTWSGLLPEQPQLIWIPIAVAVLYALLFVLLYFVLHRFDARSVFVGKYLSVHDAGGTSAVFEIKFKRFEREYRLAGRTYNVDDGVVKAVGTWDSDHMLLHVAHKELQYIFWGRTVDFKVIGYGYANINFTNNDMTRGYGYFVDESKDDTIPRNRSRYLKLTSDITAEVLGDSGKGVGTEQDEREFIKKFSALDPKVRETLIGVAKYAAP
jgi:hypothetical protein